MGLFDRFRNTQTNSVNSTVAKPTPTIVAAVTPTESEQSWQLTFNDRKITYTGDLKGFDYTNILKDKQTNINQLYQLADYYVDADPIFGGIIKLAYVPFTLANKWKLVGSNEKTKRKYEDYYRRIGLRDFEASVYYQYYKYGNVYVYLMEDGSLITLPVHKTRIANIMLGGEPVLEFNARSIRDDLQNTGIIAKKDFIKDEELEVRLRGFPREVIQAVKDNAEWVQLNPYNTFVMQGMKEDWTRYSIPMIAAALPSLSKKALISEWENAVLNLGRLGFVHAKYGDPNNVVAADARQLAMVNTLVSGAMKRTSLATTNNWVDIEFIQADTRDLYEFDKYGDVNADILSAGGISGIIVNGLAEDGSSFASAQVSMQTAEMRIQHARDNFCEMMNKINRRTNGVGITRSAEGNIPEFTYPPVDLAKRAQFQENCFKLWQLGVISTGTLLQSYGFDIGQEIARRKTEKANGTDEVLAARTADSKANEGATTTDGGHEVGRPEMDDTETDKSKSLTGKIPKPSSPEGSME